MAGGEAVGPGQGREVRVGDVDSGEGQEVRHSEQEVGGQLGRGGNLKRNIQNSITRIIEKSTMN